MTAAQILVIEDHPANLALIVYLLEAHGYRVRSAIDGEAGWRAAQAARPDLILCDVHLPKRDGYEVLGLLKGVAALRTVPVIAVTALAMVGDRDKMLAAGFDGYIAKPIEAASFIGQIEAFLAQALHAPRRAVSHAASTAAPAAASVPARATILVVDDLPLNRELIRSTLAPFGYGLLFAESAQSAWQRAHSEHYDLILCDLHMPGGDGFDLIRRLRADTTLAQVPFVFLTSTSGNDADPQLARALGALRFLRRPIAPQALVDQIEACLNGQPEGAPAWPRS